MKVEHATFNQLALELFRDQFITEGDYARITNSLAGKGDGFIADLDELAQCIRTGLATGIFQLTERLNRVFERPSKTKRLPIFLGVPLSKVFNPWGELRDDRCAFTAATCLQLCDALKRTDPARDRVPLLESQVWSKLKDNFEDEQRVLKGIASRLDSDLQFRTIFFKARENFRRLVDLPLEAHFAYGPGKNRDRYDAMTGMDWYVTEPYPWHDVPPLPVREMVDELARQCNHSPFEGAPIGKYPVKLGEAIMKCSAQPKSYKAYRGVGVTSAFRMIVQLSLQRTFYAKGLTENLPLRDQDEMRRNLTDNWNQIGTIDLSSASDRCYWSILHAFGEGIPFFDTCYRYRTKFLDLPTGRVKCASPVMGEAITFPLMSAYFASIALAVSDHFGGDPSLIRVYGDDIQTDSYDQTIAFLEMMGSIPSRSKSYPPYSYFKESCEGHYVANDNGHLRNARPAYIPSGDFTPRNTVSHADSFKLLTLAKEAFLRFPALARACVSVVEQNTSLGRLPAVPFNSPFLGRPTLSTRSTAHVVPVLYHDKDVSVSERGYHRIMLRSVEHGPDAKLHHKQVYRLMSKRVAKLRINDEFASLKDEIFARALKRNFPTTYADLLQQGKSRKFVADLSRSLCTDGMLVNEINDVIKLLRAEE